MTTHTGLDHVRAHWDAIGNARQENAVAFVPEGESFFATGVGAAGRFLASLPARHAGTTKLTILELGAGLGRVTASLARAGHRVLAVDIAPAMIDALTVLSDQLKTEGCEGSVTPLLSDGTNLHTFGFNPPIDVIYSDSVLLHNLKKDVRVILGSCARAVRPGGSVIVQLPCYSHSGKEPENFTDVGVWTPKEIAEAAGAAGLLVERIAVNPGAFSFSAIGDYHADFHVLREPHAGIDDMVKTMTRQAQEISADVINQLRTTAQSLLDENKQLRAQIETMIAERSPNPL